MIQVKLHDGSSIDMIIHGEGPAILTRSYRSHASQACSACSSSLVGREYARPLRDTSS
ncbi:hypothetical protein [Paenibacillus sp.]|jgi:hypothetical protein|uniref:hypothetical protein n=1 Tax=Paenibacillus sp. TaxID=58172 RepID=UPI0028392412|nr:hypothetical protein [Paenibacillus sp.]MDR0267132.1 hypothetical protein [Paenibacillus sp.]